MNTCMYNRTVSSRNPNYNPRDPKQTCGKTPTKKVKIHRRFVMGTYVLELDLCEEHKDWFF